MNATNPHAARLVLEKLGHLPATADKVMDKAVTVARTFFEERGLPVDTSLFPNLVRYEAKLLFGEPEARAAGYQLAVLSNNGLQLVYRHDGTLYSIRVRKADEDGEVPTKNLSETVKQFCKQDDPFLPGMELDRWEEFENQAVFLSPELLNLFIIWDVDSHFGYTGCGLACPKDEFGNLYFADQIPHSITTITVEESFDEEPEELEGIDVRPLEKTGSEDGDDESND